VGAAAKCTCARTRGPGLYSPGSRAEASLQTLIPADELIALNIAFESADPREVLEWALVTSGIERIAVASAFQTEGTVVMHMATQIRPGIPVLFLETGYQFAETLAFKEQMAERLGLNVIDLVGRYSVEQQTAEFGARLFERDPEMCCDLNKVRPMFEALRGFDAWITALRRDSSPTRANAPFVDQYEIEPDRWMVKVNPMATWSHQEVWKYLKEHDLPHNPLYDLGYSSIGCAPCTRMRFAGEPERAGRWAGKPKWECGIHGAETAVQEQIAAEER
jgi:phosphoadenosine phosphosulfate reductase